MVLVEECRSGSHFSKKDVVTSLQSCVTIVWSTGTGSKVIQRIAVPMIGGMASSTVLTLVVIPAVYGLIRRLARST
jgi:copper/silver efflux system protein